MKNNLYVSIKEKLFPFSSFLLLLSLLLVTNSCQKDIQIQDKKNVGKNNLSSNIQNSSTAIYYGHEKFTRGIYAPVVITKQIGSKNLENFKENFTLYVQNGYGKISLLSSAIIKIDGKAVFSPSDFSQKVSTLSKEITGLTVTSKLEVEVRGGPGGFIDLWIEGTRKGPIYGPMVYDIDGNSYHTVQLGNQWWMVENLKVTHFNNGIHIPDVTDNSQWEGLNTAAYCWYNNDEATYKSGYGALYNHYAAYSKELCPVGWHVPSFTEWNILIDYLGGVDTAAGKLKESGITHWESPNTGATNESGFTALPGGIRTLWEDGTSFRTINTEGNWWSSTPPSGIYNMSDWLHLQYDLDYVGYYSGSNAETIGMSIRCIKDENAP